MNTSTIEEEADRARYMLAATDGPLLRIFRHRRFRYRMQPCAKNRSINTANSPDFQKPRHLRH